MGWRERQTNTKTNHGLRSVSSSVAALYECLSSLTKIDLLPCFIIINHTSAFSAMGSQNVCPEKGL